MFSTRCLISSALRLATGWGTSTYWKPGKPYVRAMASAVILKALVQTETAGTPCRSKRIPSAKLAALQEP